ncbi:MAG: ribonuclease BN, partial [Jatrophihabitans sp.]
MAAPFPSRPAAGTQDRSGSSAIPETPTDIPKAGWVTILKRSLKQFKHDDVTDRAAALTYYGVLAI